ncbi:hypothetical protein HRED_10467 [Candidatus Haloredivivus sp. G17]|nr:hypothetical protein HRED_10467 [Candidatus Haloredivivus sp. G17]
MGLSEDAESERLQEKIQESNRSRHNLKTTLKI